MIEGMKSIKYLSWESIFEKKINAFRKKEFSILVWIKTSDGAITVFWNTIQYILLYAFIISYLDLGNELSDANVFTIIALFGFLTFPLGMIVTTYFFIFLKNNLFKIN